MSSFAVRERIVESPVELEKKVDYFFSHPPEEEHYFWISLSNRVLCETEIPILKA